MGVIVPQYPFALEIMQGQGIFNAGRFVKVGLNLAGFYFNSASPADLDDITVHINKGFQRIISLLFHC